MKFISTLWPSRAQRIIAVLYLILGAVACGLPLVGLIGYESAALFAVVGGFAGVIGTHWTWAQLRLPAMVSATSRRSPARRFGDLYIRHLAAFIAPLVLLTLNAFRVENCDPMAGYAFGAVLVLPSVAVGQAIATVSIAVGGQRAWLRRLISVAVVLGSVVWFAAHLALEPPITGFQLFLGYFSGSIYDEALAVPGSLVAYRVMCLLGVAVALGGLEAVWRMKTHGKPEGFGLVSLAAAIVLLALWTHRSELYGIDITGADIHEQLGGMVETEHFVIYFPATGHYRDVLDELKDDHEFRYYEMQQFFDIDPVALNGEKVTSYVYPNREVKGRLMGGRRTLVAKLWLGEMHILWRQPGDHLLAHELAHIFTAPFGTGPLKLSTKLGVGVNMGLVEGIATAADWPATHMTPHEAAAALRGTENAPDIRKLLGATGFWAQSSGRAYTLMGSFIRYLRDTYGIEKVRQSYGKGEFELAFGKPMETLVGEWEVFIETVELTAQEKARAEFLYDRPSIFQKKCARVIAEWRREAAVAKNSQRLELADTLYQRVLSFDPNPRYRLEYARFLMDVQRFEDAQRAAQEVVEGQHGRSLEAQARQLLGDVLWVGGRLEDAEREYSTCLELGVPLNVHRLVSVKKRTLADASPPARELALDYLLRQPDSDVALFYPGDWVRRNPHNPIANYLLGRRLWASAEYQRALEFLEPARGATGVDVLDWETELMYGQSLYWLGHVGKSIRIFEGLQKSAGGSSPYRERAREWLDRARWREARNRVETR